MSDSGEEDQETYSGCVLKKEQRVRIKIECLRGNTVPMITAYLHEACSHDAVNRSTVTQLFKQVQEKRRSMEDEVCISHPSTNIDSTLNVIVSTLLD